MVMQYEVVCTVFITQNTFVIYMYGVGLSCSVYGISDEG